MKNVLISLSFILISFLAYSQKKPEEHKKEKFFISAGYGLAGSFFVRSYTETLPFPSNNYRAFYKKRFVGNSQDFSFGLRLNKNYELKAGVNYQHFTRHVKATDTVQSVVIYLDNTIHHRSYMYYISLDKIFERKKNLFFTGLGLYYLRDQAELIEYGTGIPNFFISKEYNYKNSNEEEGGAFIEFSYEYKFQAKVNLGIRTKFYYTISTAEAESITLYPYIRISL